MHSTVNGRGPDPRLNRRPPYTLPGVANGPAAQEWDVVIRRLDVALQPIVNIHTGACYGYEALLRNFQPSGFSSPQEVFDSAHALGVLGRLDLELREKAIGKFAQIPSCAGAKLFINLDNRLLGRGAANDDWTRLVLEAHGLSPSSVIFEISELYAPNGATDPVRLFYELRAGGFRLAVDDYGTGVAGLQMLYTAEPDFLKIDRFFISGIGQDARKRLFLSQIVGMAHLLGMVVVAEGVETDAEFMVCREAGCDLVQGYLIQRPTQDPGLLLPHYDKVAAMIRHDRRRPSSDQHLIMGQLDTHPPLSVNMPMDEVFETFRANLGRNWFAVVDSFYEPLGIVRERELKEYAFSRFGLALMSNRGLGRRLKDFVVRCPVADANSKAESILQAYSSVDQCEGIIVVNERRYAGFLTADSLLRIVNEKSLAQAREQNPLTKLPGNVSIHQYVSEILEDSGQDHILVYFDFDNFKPFNDTMGFRLGDRAILMFAELLAKQMASRERFIGHIGGDDFFAGFKGESLDACRDGVARLITTFRGDAASFYDEETRARGHILASDRSTGERREFPLLGVSAAILHLPAAGEGRCQDMIGRQIALLKKEAKTSPNRLAVGVG